MGKINVLSFEIANLIAAGEVVERPSSVVKELIENSIDSGAKNIVAEIKRGGVSLIRVTDDGCGIDKEDLPIALKRHATSKIRDKDDLATIMTLGFRGEALAAIASVSSLTIITKTKESDVGYMLSSEAGQVVDLAEVGSADGTTVVVKDLFYNVPARRKFLKKDATEAMNVAALVEKVALSRPDISIQLLIDGEEKFKTPGDNSLYNTVYAVFGKSFATKLIEISGVANGITVSGYVGRSDNVKKNRNNMNVFINGRYVKSLTVQAAIERAFTSYIAPDCFPSCVLFIKMNPAFIDVNVHPAKLEVKFSDERVVFETVYYTVKNALESYEYRPEMELLKRQSDANPKGAFVPLGADTKGEQIKVSFSQSSNRTAAFARDVQSPDKKSFTPPAYVRNDTKYDLDTPLRVRSEGQPLKRNVNTADSYGAMSPKNSVELLERYRTASAANADTVSAQPIEATAEVSEIHPPCENTEINIEYKYIGEAFNCYVIIEYQGDLLIIDKHAAHERVLFEDLKKSRESDGRLATQILMLPIPVQLDAEELACARENRDELTSFGFDFEISGERCELTAIPSVIDVDSVQTLFVKMLDEIVEGTGQPGITESARREKTLYQVACKAAIKGGRVYDRAIIEWLIMKVLSLPDITVCPHGRPIAYKLTKRELDKQFDRIK